MTLCDYGQASRTQRYKLQAQVFRRKTNTQPSLINANCGLRTYNF